MKVSMFPVTPDLQPLFPAVYPEIETEIHNQPQMLWLTYKIQL